MMVKCFDVSDANARCPKAVSGVWAYPMRIEFVGIKVKVVGTIVSVGSPVGWWTASWLPVVEPMVL